MAKATLSLTLESSTTVRLVLSRKGAAPSVQEFQFPSQDDAMAGIIRAMEATRELMQTPA